MRCNIDAPNFLKIEIEALFGKTVISCFSNEVKETDSSLTLRRDEGCQSEVGETYGGGRRPKPYGKESTSEPYETNFTNSDQQDKEDGSVFTEEYNSSGHGVPRSGVSGTYSDERVSDASSTKLIDDIIRNGHNIKNGNRVNQELLKRLVELKRTNRPLYFQVIDSVGFPDKVRESVNQNVTKYIRDMKKKMDGNANKTSEG
jgi:hypothetical protein